MTSFADARVAAAVACLAIASTGPPSDRLAGEAVERFAERWRVVPESIRVEWGRIPAGLERAEGPLLVAGGGLGGWFVATVGSGDSAVAVRVRAGVVEPTMVAARALGRGARIAEGDLEPGTRVRWGGPTAAIDAPGVGWEVRRPIAAGETVEPPAVAPPPLIKSGDPVRMTWSRGAVSVSRVGVAINSARRGERVHARCEGRAHLEGVVSAPGVATLPGGEP
jgi:flagella basal body P-ring formation protein FlgA